MFKLKYNYLRLLPLFNSGGTDGHLRSSLQKKIIITTFSSSCNKGEIRLAYYVI